MKYLLIVFSLFFFNSSAFAIYPTPVKSKHGMVVSEHKIASRIGADILQQGGNAIDAAVAVGYALAVVNPCCGNIGGGGFMLIHLAGGKNIFLNFREKAPLAATATMYLDKEGNVIPEKSTRGGLAVAVPGTVMGLETALKKYGTMTRQQVMAPAIQLAENGFILKDADVKLLEPETKHFQAEKNVAAIFLKNGAAYQAGDRLIQTHLAKTLKQISELGADGFYKGPLAKTIVDNNKLQGGILSEDDFAHYTVQELEPVECRYHAYQVISAPPPSSGGVTLCEILNILDNYPLQDWGFHSAQGSHYVIEAMRYAFADRNKNLGDPDFVKNPIERLTSRAYASQIRHLISSDTATPSEKLSSFLVHEGENTTHYTVMDKLGNAVAVTYTLNSYFGAGIIAGDTGFFLNNEMDDFTLKPGAPNQFGLIQGSANNIQPGKRPLSSMAPTMLLRNNNVYMALGSPGGPRIITSVAQTILNVLDYGMDIQAAVDSPRFHHQFLPDVVEIEPFTFSADTLQKLTTMGYVFGGQKPWGAVEAILSSQGTMYGGSDNRRPAGAAVGLK